MGVLLAFGPDIFDEGKIGLGLVATGDQSRCFHGRRSCQFCFRGKPARTRQRHPCCGRFRSKRVTRCARCVEAGVTALRLF